MKTAAPDETKKLPTLRFDQSTSESVAVVAQRSWWEKNEYRVGGALRVISRGANIASGLGIGTDKSPWRVVSGSLGLLAGLFLAVFGEKDKAHNPTGPLGQINQQQVGRIYHGMAAIGGAAAVISGLVTKPKRLRETFSGLWMAIWSAYAALAPEGDQTPSVPIFDKGAMHAEPVGFMEKEKKQSLLEKYKHSPKKLAADMLQLSALWVVRDGIKGSGKPDVARIISGITLGASNYLQREMKDADFVATQPSVGR